MYVCILTDIIVGVCICNTGYAGADCSIDINAPPTATSLDDTQCVSTIASACTSVTMRGDNFVENANVSCHFTQVEVRVFYTTDFHCI